MGRAQRWQWQRLSRREDVAMNRNESGAHPIPAPVRSFPSESVPLRQGAQSIRTRPPNGCLARSSLQADWCRRAHSAASTRVQGTEDVGKHLKPCLGSLFGQPAAATAPRTWTPRSAALCGVGHAHDPTTAALITLRRRLYRAAVLICGHVSTRIPHPWYSGPLM
ncbi:hypothetical protein PSPO01_00304 [Paraphaeosphaeria sporulosa]